MKELTLAEAAALLQPGMTAFIHGGVTEPRRFVEQLAAEPTVLTGVQLMCSFIPGINDTNLAGLAPDSHVTAFMHQPGLTPAIATGQATALRMPYSSVVKYLEDLPAIDLAVIRGRMTEGGVSTSMTGEFLPLVAERATEVCLIHDEALPVPANGTYVPVSCINWRVRVTGPLQEYPTAGRMDVVSEAIAANVATLIDDGDAIETGIGLVPAALYAKLHKRRNLRIRTGMFGDALVDLAAAGALDTDYEHSAAFALGTRKLFRWLEERPDCRIAPCTETHNLDALVMVERFAAVNSALEVGLDGSVNAEQVGAKVVSGPGGLPDYAWAGAHCRGGRSIIALPSANHKHGISRIVPSIANAHAPTVPADHVTHVVTEHGVAEIAGVDAEERCRRLIAIADPAHRQALVQASS